MCSYFGNNANIVKHLLIDNSLNGVLYLKNYYNNFVNIRYKAGDKKYHIKNVGYLRSLVINSDSNEIVCVSPPKAVSNSEFYDSHRWWCDDYDCLCSLVSYSSMDELREHMCKSHTEKLKDPLFTEELKGILFTEEAVEGIMMNIFWDKDVNGWQHASLGKYDHLHYLQYVQNSFNITFRMMFDEALKGLNLDLKVLPKQFCYSFIVQHPLTLNMFNVPTDKPTIVLVETHLIDANGFHIMNPYEPSLLRECIDRYNIPIPKKDVESGNRFLKNYCSGMRTKFV